MSLGFLTESALVPSKATPIKVDSQSLVDLKAVVFQKDQERQQRLRDALETSEVGGSGRNLAKYAHLRGKSRKRGGSASLSREEDRLGKRGTNRGVEKRSRCDEAAVELDIGERDDDAAMARKSKAMLEKKAKLYEQMMSGRGQVGAVASEFLVDFESKRLASSEDKRVAAPQSEADPVEIVDEFGRTRRVPRGSPEHLEFVEASRCKDKQQQDDHSYDRDHGTRDEGDATTERGGGGSFVVSQWEHRLNATEKTYLHQVHERAVFAKAAAPSTGAAKMSKKQLRLEKLRQERAKATAAKEKLGTAATASSASSPKTRDTPGAAPVNDAAVSAQATDFLNQLSSLM